MEEQQLMARREASQLFAKRMSRFQKSSFFRVVGSLIIFTLILGVINLDWIVVAVCLGLFVTMPICIILTVKYSMYKSKTR